MKTKNIVAVLLVATILASCDMPSAPTTTPTLTLTPIPTVTQTPTLTPTMTPPPTPTQVGGGSGRLIFRLRKEEFIDAFPDLIGESHVFLANLDGTDFTPITVGLESQNYLSDISPDGTRALIVSYSDGKPQYATLFMVNLKSMASEPVRLVDKVAWEYSDTQTAMWLDNSQIIYIGQGESGFGIYKTNVDDNRPIILAGSDVGITPYEIRGVTSTYIYWDTQMAGREATYDYKVYWTSLVDGETNPLMFNGQSVKISSGFGNDFALSPDGNYIAWSSRSISDGTTYKIYVAPIADFDNPIKSIDPISQTDLFWFPDGEGVLNYDGESVGFLKSSDEVIGRLSEDADKDIFGIYEIPLSPDLPIKSYKLPIEVMYQNFNNRRYKMNVLDISPDGRLLIVTTLEKNGDDYTSIYNILDLETLELTKLNFTSIFSVHWIP